MANAESGRRWKIPSTLIDIAVALAVVATILIAMFIYTGLWPPLVVVESKSMQHSNDRSYIGTIDTGDLVLVKKIQNELDITTYFEGKMENHRTYGDFGDVIVYKRGGADEYTPIIHRAILYLENNDNYSFRAEELRFFTEGSDYVFLNEEDSWDNITGTIRIFNFGFGNDRLDIPVGMIIADMRYRNIPLHDGFITKGDLNPNIDQEMWTISTKEPVAIDWIVGKAKGELPWFGIMKLWFTGELPPDTPSNSIRNLWLSIALIIAVPVGFEAFLWWRARRKAEEEPQADEQEEMGSYEQLSAEEAVLIEEDSEGIVEDSPAIEDEDTDSEES